MILFDKICSTGVKYCGVVQSPYNSNNMLPIVNKGGETGIFILFFFYFILLFFFAKKKKTPRRANLNLFSPYLGALIRIRTFSSLDHLSAIEIEEKLQFY